jgi:hypothetical protein
VAEGTSLLRKHTGKTCIVGSNPTVSARFKQKAPTSSGLFAFPNEVAAPSRGTGS